MMMADGVFVKEEKWQLWSIIDVLLAAQHTVCDLLVFRSLIPLINCLQVLFTNIDKQYLFSMN